MGGKWREPMAEVTLLLLGSHCGLCASSLLLVSKKGFSLSTPGIHLPLHTALPQEAESFTNPGGPLLHPQAARHGPIPRQEGTGAPRPPVTVTGGNIHLIQAAPEPHPPASLYQE